LYIDPITGEKKWILVPRTASEIAEYKARKILEAEEAERQRKILENLLNSPRMKELKKDSPVSWEEKVDVLRKKIEKERKIEEQKKENDGKH